MGVYEGTNSFVHNRDITRHWDALSEAYTGGDSLFTALQNGWEVQSISCEQYVLQNQYTRIYHFELRQGNDIMVMPVTSNPYVLRIITQPDVTIENIHTFEEHEI